MKVGVFDSGLGGLTVVKEMLRLLSGVEILYLADTHHAPYGEKSSEAIRAYAHRIADYFIEHHRIDALVVACNSATTAAIASLRENYPDLTIVGTEPGIKPAIAATKSGKIGVLATRATLRSEKYRALAERLSHGKEIEIFEQACPGLAEAIEKGELEHPDTMRKLRGWIMPMREAGVDTIVLGCTHYPLAEEQIRNLYASSPLTLIETGEAIARRLSDLLGITHREGTVSSSPLTVFATGAIDRRSVARILGFSVSVHDVSLF